MRLVIILFQTVLAFGQKLPSALDVKHASQVPIPPPADVRTYSHDGFDVHILENRNTHSSSSSNRSALLLGTFSNPAAVSNSRDYINPSTGKPFDVVIGLGASNLNVELGRVLGDNRNADANAAALRTAIIEHFGEPLKISTLDTHSNGTTVGIAAVLQGTFTGVRQLNLNGPDVGYGGKYVDPESFSRLKAEGVQSIDIYRSKSDIVPMIGELSKIAVGSVGGNLVNGELADQTLKAVKAFTEIATSPLDTARPEVHVVELPSTGNFLQSHFISNMLERRLEYTNNQPTVVLKTSEGVAQNEKGVRIAVDDEVLAKAISLGNSRENEAALSRLGEQLLISHDSSEAERCLSRFTNNLCSRLKQNGSPIAVDDIVLVSLRELMSAANAFTARWVDLPDNLRHPGAISRIFGYVLVPETNDVVLVGQSNHSAQPIDIDDLIVGIRAVFKEHRVPICSLDPEPSDVSGPQKVRLDGIPVDSAFGLKMLEADYLMKRIVLGFEPTPVQGYRSLRSLWLLSPPKRATNRFWLYPFQPQPGEIQLASNKRAALFMSGTQLLSEQMVQTHDGFAGSGLVDPTADEAAASFTVHYAELAERHPEFQRLQGLFDIVLMARLWQHTKVVSGVLDRFAELPYTRIRVPESFSGLRAEVPVPGGLAVVIAGGVHASGGSSARSLLPLDDSDMSSLQSNAQQMSMKPKGIYLRPSIRLTMIRTDKERRDQAGLIVASVLRKLASHDIEGASVLINLKQNSSDPQLIAVRSLLDFAMGKLSAAKNDALVAERMDSDTPQIAAITSAVLFELSLLEGQPEIALRWADSGIQRSPASIHLRILRSEALLELRRFADAKEELSTAVQMDPTSALALARLGMIDLSEGWFASGRKHIRRASLMANTLGQDTPEIKVARALAEVTSAFYGNVSKQMAEGRVLAEEVLRDPFCDPKSALRAFMVVATAAIFVNDWNEVDAQIARAKRIAPLNPEVLVAAGKIAHQVKRDDFARKYLEQARTIAPHHPSVEALVRVLNGS